MPTNGKNKDRCKRCDGKGKVRCDCFDIETMGHGVKELVKTEKGHYILEILHVSVHNKGIKRKVSLEIRVEYMKNDLLAEKDRIPTITRTILDIEVINGDDNITPDKLKNPEDFIFDLGDLNTIKETLGIEPKQSDFGVERRIIDAKPDTKCKDCKGIGLKPCPICSQKIKDGIMKSMMETSKSKIITDEYLVVGYLIVWYIVLMSVIIYTYLHAPEIGDSLITSTIYICSFGGLGGTTSCLIELIRNKNKFSSNNSWANFLKPLVGIVFGYVFYLLIEGGLINLVNIIIPSFSPSLKLYCGLSFLAGLSISTCEEGFKNILKKIFREQNIQIK